MSMIDVFREMGRTNALKLREEAAKMSGTKIIAREYDAPQWDAQKDYSGWPAGSPVTDEGQVWLLLQPHNAAHYSGRPSDLRALWGLAHTTDPAKAKPWVHPYGTSGMYMRGEVYKDDAGKVWRALEDNLVYNAEIYPRGWEAA